jgi:hypothetical protein
MVLMNRNRTAILTALLFTVLASLACGGLDGSLTPTTATIPPVPTEWWPTDTPSPTDTPLPTDTPTPVPSPTPFIPWEGLVTPGALPPTALAQAILTDWQAYFDALWNYETVSQDGRPNDKDWWIEQNRYYSIDPILTNWLENIDEYFTPGTKEFPAFMEEISESSITGYCISDSHCSLEVQWSSMKYWMYVVAEAESVHETGWHDMGTDSAHVCFVLQYDVDEGRWMVSDAMPDGCPDLEDVVLTLTPVSE